MKKSFKLKIFGRVQGVFFRLSTKDKAEALGLTGWVKNVPDGTVELEVEGEEEKITEFLNWCKEGPQMATVEDIQIEENKTLKNYIDFQVLG